MIKYEYDINNKVYNLSITNGFTLYRAFVGESECINYINNKLSNDMFVMDYNYVPASFVKGKILSNLNNKFYYDYKQKNMQNENVDR